MPPPHLFRYLALHLYITICASTKACAGHQMLCPICRNSDGLEVSPQSRLSAEIRRCRRTGSPSREIRTRRNVFAMLGPSPCRTQILESFISIYFSIMNAGKVGKGRPLISLSGSRLRSLDLGSNTGTFSLMEGRWPFLVLEQEKHILSESWEAYILPMAKRLC